MRMRTRHLCAVLVPLAGQAADAYTPASTHLTDQIAASSLANQLATLNNGSLAKLLATENLTRTTCSPSEIVVRREYSHLTDAEKLAYTDAVLCLMDAPTKTPASACPGCRSRYDDFVATHINQTETIHFTGSFLYWHRYYIWAFEQALRDECGYKVSNKQKLKSATFSYFPD